MRAAGLIAHLRTLRDHPGQLQHVVKLAREDNRRVGPLRPITEIDLAIALEHLDQLGIRLLQILVVADDRAILGHQLAQYHATTSPDSPFRRSSSAMRYSLPAFSFRPHSSHFRQKVPVDRAHTARHWARQLPPP